MASWSYWYDIPGLAMVSFMAQVSLSAILYKKNIFFTQVALDSRHKTRRCEQRRSVWHVPVRHKIHPLPKQHHARNAHGAF